MIQGGKAVRLFLPATGKPLEHHLADLAERVLDGNFEQGKIQPLRFLPHRLGDCLEVPAGLDGKPYTVQLRQLPNKLTLHGFIITAKVACSKQQVARGKPVVGIGVINDIDIGDLRLQAAAARDKRQSRKLLLP